MVCYHKLMAKREGILIGNSFYSSDLMSFSLKSLNESLLGFVAACSLRRWASGHWHGRKLTVITHLLVVLFIYDARKCNKDPQKNYLFHRRHSVRQTDKHTHTDEIPNVEDKKGPRFARSMILWPEKRIVYENNMSTIVFILNNTLIVTMKKRDFVMLCWQNKRHRKFWRKY